MDFGALEKILDINFSPDIDISSHISNITLINIENNKQISKEGDSLKINLAELTEEQRRELLDPTRDHLEVEGRILEKDAEAETNAIKNGYEKDYDEILEYFEPFLSDLYYRMLEKGLHLRAAINKQDLRLNEIKDRKRDIAKKTSPKAYYMTSLVTAGYFDEDGGLRDLNVDIRLNKDQDNNFQEELDRLVDEELLCIFVERDDDANKVVNKVENKLEKFNKNEQIHDWLDIRGIGDECSDIIDTVVENLNEEYIGIDMDTWRDGDRTVVRIYPHSIGSINN